MKAIVPLFIATLFVVCSAFPAYEKITKGQESNKITRGQESNNFEKLTKGQESNNFDKLTKGQESNNFCATLAYPQRDPAAYVHLCYTPREGTTRTRSRICVDVPVYLILLAGLVAIYSRFTSLICMQSYTNLSLLLHYYCRYLHRGKSS